MFGNKSRKNNDNNFAPLTNNTAVSDHHKSSWSIISGYISSAVSAGQDDYGAPVVNFKVIIPLKHPTSIHYGYYAITGGRRVPEIQTEMIDHWDYQCTKYSSDPVNEVKRLQSDKGDLVEVTGHRVDGTFKLKKNGFSIQTRSRNDAANSAVSHSVKDHKTNK